MAHQASSSAALRQQLFEIHRDNFYLENYNLAEDERHERWMSKAAGLASFLGISIPKNGNIEVSKRTGSSPMMKSKSVSDLVVCSTINLANHCLGAASFAKTEFKDVSRTECLLECENTASKTLEHKPWTCVTDFSIPAFTQTSTYLSSQIPTNQFRASIVYASVVGG